MPRHPDHHLALIQKAQDGDQTALEEVKRLHAPDHYIWQQMGDLAAQVEGSLLRSALGSNSLAKEAVTRHLAGLRAELAGPNPTTLEKLLVERVAACWLQVQTVELFLAQQRGTLSIKQAGYHEGRLDRAHRRYLSAIKSLAQVRKLLVPATVQVNVALDGGQQVNQVNVADADQPCPESLRW